MLGGQFVVLEVVLRKLVCFALLFGSITSAETQAVLRGPGAAALDPFFPKVLNAPGNVELNLIFARRAIELEDFEAAVSTLERLLVGRAGLPLIRLELGMLYLRLEASELAEAYFLQVLDTQGLEDEVRERAEILLANARTAGSHNKFAINLAVGAKHQSNANTGPSFNDQNQADLRRTQLIYGDAAHGVATLVSDTNTTSQHDNSSNMTLGLAYSRELAGLREHRFDASANYFASEQQDRKLDALDLKVLNVRFGWFFNATKDNQAPLNYTPYLSVRSLDTGDFDEYATSYGIGLGVSTYIGPRNPVMYSVELGSKEHKNFTSQPDNHKKDGGRYNLGVSLGRIHTGGSYSSMSLRLDRAEADNNYEAQTGGYVALNHSRSMGLVSVAANLGWREARRDGPQNAPGIPQARLRYDKDLSADLTFGRSVLGTRISLNFGYIRRQSNLVEFQYDDTNASLMIARSIRL